MFVDSSYDGNQWGLLVLKSLYFLKIFSIMYHINDVEKIFLNTGV